MDSFFDKTIKQLGFARAATAISIRCIATCYGMCFRPDPRALIGIGIFQVVPEADGYRFSGTARALRGGEMPADLLDWLEPVLPRIGPVIGWELADVVRRLKAVATPLRHPTVLSLGEAPGHRLRDLPTDIPRSIRPGSAGSLPCFACPSLADCIPQLPAFALPPRQQTETQLVHEAADAWAAWANCHGDFAQHDHPAQVALRALGQAGGVRSVAAR